MRWWELGRDNDSLASAVGSIGGRGTTANLALATEQTGQRGLLWGRGVLAVVLWRGRRRGRRGRTFVGLGGDDRGIDKMRIGRIAVQTRSLGSWVGLELVKLDRTLPFEILAVLEAALVAHCLPLLDIEIVLGRNWRSRGIRVRRGRLGGRGSRSSSWLIVHMFSRLTH